MQHIEEKLNDLFVKKMPALPEGGRRGLVKALPWLTLIGGIISLWGVWGIYQLATIASRLTTFTDDLSNAYGVPTTVNSLAVGPLIWISMAVLVVEAILFFIAFPALRHQKKSGWSVLFWVAVVNVLFAVVSVISTVNIVSFIFSLIGSAIGFYLLFQVRAYYLPGAPKLTNTPPPAKPGATPPSSSTTPPTTPPTNA